MKFVCPYINNVFDTECGSINSLVIENQDLFVRLLKDIYSQMNGDDGVSVVSSNDKILDLSKNVEVIDSFVDFEINKKNLISKIVTKIESIANSETFISDSYKLLSNIESYLNDISFELTGDIFFSNIGILSIIKACSPVIRDEYDSIAEKVIDYFELVSEYDRKKLFITVNMRSFVSDSEVQLFVDTVLSHEYNVIMVENREYNKLLKENRFIVDSELCEIK